MSAVTNSVVNGHENPIQVQIQDAVKCFDKLWLEETTNALYEAGLKTDMLNLLYMENKRAKVAIKVNGNLTDRISVKNVELQGSVWGSLKCTASMDQLNKIILPQDELTYKYKGDPDISIGVLGMVDDNLAIALCGTSSVLKNSVINSFFETQRLSLSEEKSVVLHIGRKHCRQTCPTLKVHNSDMKTVQSARYLGDVISSSGSLGPCIEDRRSKGWGKVADMKGILSEMPSDRRIEVGLKLREAKVHNGILYNSEAWSNLADKDMDKFEQVDMASIRALMDGGHSKCPKAFYFLEFGTLMVRHLVMIRRLMYHRHILTRDNTEIIKKIYMKQKVNACKGDWIKLIEKDFLFIEEEINEDWISRTGKDEYNSYIKEKVKVAAFNEYIQLKQKCKKKLKYIHYTDFSIQPYLKSNKISLQEKQLLWSLRSKCYPAKSNFSKMNRGT